MAFDRRQFMRGTASLAALVSSPVTAQSSRLHILFLGGTGFLGPHTVQYALDRGHEVTLFNRGQTNSDMFPELEKIVGDRDPDVGAGLSGLRGKTFDAVIDTSGYVPRIVGASAQLMADQAEHYLFVSTICQYENWIEGPQFRTEETPRATLEDPSTEDVQANYCALKAYCERAAEAAMPGRVNHMRPGLIVGPRDQTDRFTYWPVRADRGGEMLAPGKPSDLTQYIDVRDLAQFMVHSVEQRLTGGYNGICTPRPIGEILDACVDVTRQDTELTWVAADFLSENGLNAWQQIPMWADSSSAMTGSLTWSAKKSLAAGMTIRPIEETVRDTLEWFRGLPDDRQAALRNGIPADEEAAVLAAWNARS